MLSNDDWHESITLQGSRCRMHMDLGSIKTCSDHLAKPKMYNFLSTPTDTHLKVIFLESFVADEGHIK